jgi:flavin reductase (DIM6/NTAB) family NADH-FMN oxidoreductase RutF
VTSKSNAPYELADRAALRRAFGVFPTGVTVVTVGGGAPHGMTANSFATVSLEPPLVLVCVGRDALMHRALVSARRFAVSVLAADQEPIARYFADRRRPLGSTQFDPVDWLPGPLTGSPLIVGAVAHFECELWRSYDGGDHSIFVGALVSLHRNAEENALLFFHGQFGRAAREATEVTT